MRYQVRLTDDAKDDLGYLRVFEQKIILEGIRSSLGDEPLTESRNRKPLRENPLAPWELRLGKYRVFYRVEEEDVIIGAVGVKEHNRLFIRGEEHQL